MYKKSVSRWLKHLDFMVLDIIAMELSLVTAVLLRHKVIGPMEVRVYSNIAWVLLLINIFVVFFNESYTGILRRGYWKEFKSCFLHVTYVLALSLFYLFMLREAIAYSRMVFLVMWGFYFLYSYVLRSIWKLGLLKRSKKNLGSRNLCIITSKDRVEAVARHIYESNRGEIRIGGIAVLDEDLRGQQFSGFPVVTNGENILDYIKENWVDEVFIDLPRKMTIPQELLDGCAEMGVTIHMKLARMTSLGMNQTVEKVAGYTVLTSSVRMATPRQMFFKRAIDICGGLVGLLLTAVAFLIVGPIIYIKSPGPIFFSQVRIGKNGKRFKIYKFRSMYMDAEERKKELMAQNQVKDGMMFKMDDDPRIIKGIGHFIRKTSIDELPQFWNVLLGDMSLVGTRPPTVDEWEKYELHHRKRLAIKPGITGMWQVSGRSNIKDFEEVVKLDTEYIMNWSIALDFRLLVKTVQVVLRREGSV